MEAAYGEVERLIATAKVVEYLEPVTSRDLLCKFPDTTAFGFDYSQSSIWSPLIPRAHIAVDPQSGTVTPKRLSDGSGAGNLRNARKKIAASPFRTSLRVMQRSRRKMMKKKKRNVKPMQKVLDFSSTPAKGCACLPLVVEVNDRKP